MKKTIRVCRGLLVLFLICFACISCSEKQVSDCDRTGASLKTFIDNNKLALATVYSMGSLVAQDVPFQINDTMISVQGTFYNICLLKSYGRDDNSVILTF